MAAGTDFYNDNCSMTEDTFLITTATNILYVMITPKL